MKPIKHYFLAALLLSFHFSSFAQKAMETSAAVEYKNNFQVALMNQDMVRAKSSLIKAKEYIDAAAAHPDTKESPKTLYLKGDIYFYIMMMKDADNTAFTNVNEQVLDDAIAAWKKAYSISDKFDIDVEQSVKEKQSLINMTAVEAYNGKKYQEAMKAFNVQARLVTAINKVDTMSIYFAGICAEQNKDWDNAVKYYKNAAGYGYRVPEIYKTIANVYIQKGDRAEALRYLQTAVVHFPDDKNLHYILGTFYMDATQNEKALEHLSKAVALDAGYMDAQYQLGALWQGQGAALRQKAKTLPANDAGYDKMIAESNAFFKKALIPLTIYIDGNPTDKDVLNTLAQLYKVLQMPEAAAQYKKRLEQLQ